jgi:CRISP-associated protein Cas1
MKHLIISEYGTFLGIESNLLAVRNVDDKKLFPLNRLVTISIAKRGVSISSDLIESLSYRGIKLFFLDFKSVQYSLLVSANQHGVVQNRINQYEYIKNNSIILAKKIIEGKIKNQRAVLNYFNKYQKSDYLSLASDKLNNIIKNLDNIHDQKELLGNEGISAKIYFKSLIDARLFTDSFKKREGRGSIEVNNSMLNFGYAILSSYILNAIINAGLEPYLGFFHQKRAGKMSLLFDLMEEYRAWIVDRSVIKLRSQSKKYNILNKDLKNNLITEIQRVMAKKYLYKKKRVKLEHIIQRQIYRLSGEFASLNKYKPYLFKW